jgi:hypothetical protein
MTPPPNRETRVDISLEADKSLLMIGFHGRITLRDLEHAHNTIATRLDGKIPTGLVLDARQSQPGYTHGELLQALEAGLDQASTQRCAFVSDEMRPDTVTLIEAACVPYAVRVRWFDDIDRAREWAAGL